MSESTYSKKEITLGLSGASGMPYAFRLLECLIEAGYRVNVLVTQAAQVVIAMETDVKCASQPDKLQAQFTKRFHAAPGQLRMYGPQEWSANIASGSAPANAMVVCPCSSGCLAAIATGMSNQLLERAADVMIKERRPLILVHRETPLSAIHLEHLLRLSQLGVTILPANPGFYHKPQSIEALVDFVVARILDHLQVSHQLVPRWGQHDES